MVPAPTPGIRLVTSRSAVVLEELPVDVLAAVEPADDRIDDAGGAVDDVERRVEAVLGGLALGDVERVLVADPTGVDAVHVDAVGVVLRRARCASSC